MRILSIPQWSPSRSSPLHAPCLPPQINSHALMSIGPHAELLLGQGRFTAVYLASALAGTAASFVLTPAPSVGASGEGALGAWGRGC